MEFRRNYLSWLVRNGGGPILKYTRDRGDDTGAAVWKLIEEKVGELERIGY
jgi:hypothetical protein